MKVKEKRNARSYKIADKTYRKAMRKAKKDKTTLAVLIESYVVAYSKDMAITYWMPYKAMIQQPEVNNV